MIFFENPNLARNSDILEEFESAQIFSTIDESLNYHSCFSCNSYVPSLTLFGFQILNSPRISFSYGLSLNL